MPRFYWLCEWHTERKLIGLRIGRVYFKLKPTSDELFSERNGYAKVIRFRGLSFIFDRDKR